VHKLSYDNLITRKTATAKGKWENWSTCKHHQSVPSMWKLNLRKTYIWNQQK